MLSSQKKTISNLLFEPEHLDLFYLHLLMASHLFSHDFSNKQHVLIVGAGISGLTAADVLHKVSNFITCEILEARDRIGGRIYTAKLGSEELPCDLGASWIHGIGKGKKEDDPKGMWRGVWNPVYKICREHKIAT